MQTSTLLTLFITAAVLFSLVLLGLAVYCFRSKEKWSTLLATSCCAGVVVLASYSASLLVGSFMAMSVFSSIYFASIDVMLVFLLIYFMGSKGIGFEGRHRLFAAAVVAIAVADCTSLLINPLTGHAMSYGFLVAGGVVHWSYIPHAAYALHLLFDYTLIVSSIVVLVYCTLKTPSVYHVRFIPIIAMILIIVLLNAVFLFLDTGILDISVLLYAVCAAFICMNDYVFREYLLRRRVGDQVLASITHPVVFFDNEGMLCFFNPSAKFMFDGVRETSSITLASFVERNGLDASLLQVSDEHSSRWSLEADGSRQQYRCDYTVLRDRRQRTLGFLFVFIDISLAVDTLTGFQTKAAFEHSVGKVSSFPACLCLFDIDRLMELNQNMGRERGDQALRAAALAMREVFPAGTDFVRMDDAMLLAFCPGRGQAKARALCAEVAKRTAQFDYGTGPLSVQSVVGEVTDEDQSLFTVGLLTRRSLMFQKMLNPNSAHSSLLDSLDQTLREADSGTEAHVRRTRSLAAKLGERLELSDYDQSSLALLCLLHDIGKLGIPLEILNKPSKLTDEEWDLMRSHVEKGYRIAMASEELHGIAPCILHHHECWDGSGYPDGLKAEAIPLLSRIVAVVDTYDAMTSNRPYRDALSVAEARAELRRCAGTQFDPYLVQQFLAVLDTMGLTGEELSAQEKPAPKELPRSFTQTEYQEGEEKGLAAVDFVEYVLDENDRIIEVGEGFERLTGYSPEDIAQLRPRQIDLIFPEDAELYRALVAKQLETSSEALMEHRLRRKDGSARNVICLGRRYFDSVTHQHRVSVAVLDTARSASVNMLLKREQERSRRTVAFWEHGARADSLTGVLNHQSFVDAVVEHTSFEECRTMLCVIDLDNFKLYNDHHGHPRGDELLVSLSEALSRYVPANGIVGRLGGDEFALALFYPSSCPDEDAAHDAKRIWGKVMRTLSAQERPASITMGAFLGDAGSFDFNMLYDSADALLYEAKEAGRSRVYFESSKLSECLDNHGNTQSLTFQA